MTNLKLKVCGMTSLQQVEQLAELGVDYAGFIFYKTSPRFVGDKIAAADLRSFTKIQKVGVFVNETESRIRETIMAYGLDAVQLHGEESPLLCAALEASVRVIKAFRLRGDEDLSALLQPYAAAASYFLFDTKAQAYGGTGQKFTWSVLEQTAIGRPYFLSGGIGPQDIEPLQAFTAQNDVFALDVNSRFETTPGIKDMAQVAAFVNQLKK